MTILIVLSSSPSSSIAASRSRRFWPCQIRTFVVPGLLDRWISSDHWERREVGAIIRVAEGLFDVNEDGCLVRKALFNFSWRLFLFLIEALSSTLSGPRLVWISADNMIVFPM